MDLALRPGPQSTLPPIPNDIRLTFSVATGTINKQMYYSCFYS